ncbi:Lysophospholipase L1 [Granulicella rosea]|uniref:Lysophospholipase L1 n=1 Tax=Granulicella rosea TaxID=474952 RepID=A0A239M5A4_9BACT|nr:rhamnogalacturonan acetylesterase [Granulicella rosea]SNT37821.1 Lysophospholipase L1 [Granulicella rosea]
MKQWIRNTMLAGMWLLPVVTHAVSCDAQAVSGALKASPREPANPALPTIFIVGDSTADISSDTANQGTAGVQGWGVFFPVFFDPSKVNVVNAARGGRSSRTFMSEGFWDKVILQMKPHDVVLIQLGQNDVFPVNDSTRARGTLPGTGPEIEEIDNMVTKKHETVHTYGWYIRKYVQDARAKGATPIVLSLTTRNVWKDGHVELGVGEYRQWARTVAQEEHNTDFVDVSAILGAEYEKFGQAKVNGLFHDRETVHMTTPGAYLAAQCIAAGLKGLPDAPVTTYLSALGQQLIPVK